MGRKRTLEEIGKVSGMIKNLPITEAEGVVYLANPNDIKELTIGIDVYVDSSVPSGMVYIIDMDAIKDFPFENHVWLNEKETPL